MDVFNLKKRISLSAKLNILSISLMLVTSVGISLYLVRTELTSYYQELLNHAITIADSTSKNCEFGVYTEDRESLLSIVVGLSGDADIAYVAALNSDQREIMSRMFGQPAPIPAIPFGRIGQEGITYTDFVDTHDGRPYLEVLAPVVSSSVGPTDDLFQERTVSRNQKIIGYLRLGMSQEGLRKRTRHLLAAASSITTVLVLAGIGLTLLLTKRITSPLKRLTTATQEIARGNFDARIEASTNDEIADLARSFDHMLVNLRTYRKQVEERTSELTASNRQLVEEVNARTIAEQQLLHDALHDTLTGLPNRALFIDRLDHAITISKRRKDYLYSVLFLDLDRFKVVNDSLGHVIGDQLLVAFGERLLVCLRPGDTVARLGGDEFAILLEDISGIGNTLFIAERITKELTSPFSVGGHEVFVTASVGIALNSADYDRPEQILRDADTAMYQAKAGVGTKHVVFEPGMHAHAVERLRLETDLRRAVERREFLVFYQPIVSVRTGRIVGFEALARWQHSERGLVNPGDFVPLAEETGIIVAIDRLVLREACRQMNSWLKRLPGISLEYVSVNLSNKQMAQPDLVSHVEQVLGETGLKPEHLKLEITENVILENPEAAAAMLARLRALGVQLYIDDFGTGYSSLSYLHRLPINGFKIDRSFIQRMGEKGEHQEIIRTILLLARDLKVEVIAEGIETESQLEQIRALNCEYWQGYLFSVPVKSAVAGALLEKTAG